MAGRMSSNSADLSGKTSSLFSADYKLPCSSSSVIWTTGGELRRAWHQKICATEDSFDCYFEKRSATGRSERVLDGLSTEGLNVVASFSPDDPFMTSDGVKVDDSPVRYNGKVETVEVPFIPFESKPDKPDAVFGASGNLAATSSVNRHVSDSLTLTCAVSAENLGFAWRISRLVKWASMLVADHRCYEVRDDLMFKRLCNMGLSGPEVRWVMHFICLGFASVTDPELSQPMPQRIFFIWKSGKRWKFRTVMIAYGSGGRSALVSIRNSRGLYRLAVRRLGVSWLAQCPTGPLIDYDGGGIHVVDGAPLCGHCGFRALAACPNCSPTDHPPLVPNYDNAIAVFSDDSNDEANF